MGEPIKITAVGDCFITRRLPENDIRAEELRNLLLKADIRFANLETTIHNNEGTPSAFSGGTWAMAAPEVINDLKYYGFNLFNAATNHSLDYLYDGLAATEKYLKEKRVIYAGIGNNLAEASRPVYIETEKERVALVACTSTFHESWTAGNQSRTMPGRPGINPLRYEPIHGITPEEAVVLQQVLDHTDVNADRNLAVKEGFSKEDSKETMLQFGPLTFDPEAGSGTKRKVKEEDKKRIVQQVKAAKGSAGVVLVSIHSHEMEGEVKSLPADFHVQFAKDLIDAGADAVIGHGPHILRGIEIYQGKPIFYSLGNFIFQNETVTDLPYDFFAKYGLQDDASIAEAFDKRSEGGKGLAFNAEVWESVVPYWEMEEGRMTKLILYPIELGFNTSRGKRGWPQLTKKTAPLERLRELSEPFGTTIEINEGGCGEVKL